MPLFALTIFVAAFLLFLVQPLIAKAILPWFGGGAGVWTVCMLFFQVLLLAGYAYAHFSTARLKPKTQAWLHLVLLATALFTLPILPGNEWKPVGTGDATLQILLLLAATLGLPYLALAASAPLFQKWFTLAYPGRSPYRLYALSNAGSLLALLGYPFLIEPQLSLAAQSGLWSGGFVLLGVMAAGCAWQLGRAPDAVTAGAPADLSSNADTFAASARPTAGQRLLWLLLPACACVLLLATTNKICQDVAAIPFLWILPLSLYLITFIICFDSPRWYLRLPVTFLLVAALALVTWALSDDSDLPMKRQLMIFLGGMFICCLACHGELYRLRPGPAHLTEFYLLIAAGGALGGVFVAVMAPLLFTHFYELHLGLALCGLLFVVSVIRGVRLEHFPGETLSAVPGRWDYWRVVSCVMPLLVFAGLDWLLTTAAKGASSIPGGWFTAFRVIMWSTLVLLVLSWLLRGRWRTFRYWRAMGMLWLGLAWAGLAVALGVQVFATSDEVIFRTRNFYGAMLVYDYLRKDPENRHHLLQHGGITHGLQFLDPDRAKWPTTYYGTNSGVEMAWDSIGSRPKRAGLVGLGTGTFLAHGRAGDYIRIYEINPEVPELAKDYFSYLTNCLAATEMVMGDARLSLEREAPQAFDLLVLDAFSSDSIPVHLLTSEAFALYRKHLAPGGVIAVHVSNHYLDLEPVVARAAAHFKFALATIDFDERAPNWWLYSSTWILLWPDGEYLKTDRIRDLSRTIEPRDSVPLWTDSYASLYSILK